MRRAGPTGQHPPTAANTVRAAQDSLLLTNQERYAAERARAIIDKHAGIVTVVWPCAASSALRIGDGGVDGYSWAANFFADGFPLGAGGCPRRLKTDPVSNSPVERGQFSAPLTADPSVPLLATPAGACLTHRRL
jgi:hypothetical protein